MAVNWNLSLYRFIQRWILNGHGNWTIDTFARSHKNLTGLRVNLGRYSLAVFVLGGHRGLAGRVLHLHTGRLLVVRRVNGVWLVSSLDGNLRLLGSRLVLAVRVGTSLDLVAIVCAVTVGISHVRVGTDLNLGAVGQTIAIGVSLLRIRRLVAVFSVLRTVQLFLVGEAITIGISLGRIGALLLFLGVAQAITIGIGLSRIGAKFLFFAVTEAITVSISLEGISAIGDLLAVLDTIAVGISLGRIGTKFLLLTVAQAVTVGVGLVRISTVGFLLLVGNAITIGILGRLLRCLVLRVRVGAGLDLVTIVDAVAIGISLIRVGAKLGLRAVSQTVAIGVSLLRIRRLVVVLAVLGTVQLLLVGEAITISIGLERISTLLLLLAIIQAIIIGIRLQRIGAVSDFVAIVDTVSVGISLVRIGTALLLLAIIQAITVGIGLVRIGAVSGLLLIGDAITIGILGRLLRCLVLHRRVGAGLDLVTIVDAVTVSIGLIRIGTNLNLGTVSQTVAIGVSLSRVRRLVVVLIVLRTVELFLIAQAVAIGIGLERIGAEFLLLTVVEAIAVGVSLIRVSAVSCFLLVGYTVAIRVLGRLIRSVSLQRVSSVLDLVAIVNAIAIGVGLLRVGTLFSLFLVSQTVIVGVSGCILNDEREGLGTSAVTVGHLNGDVVYSIAVLSYEVSGTLVVLRRTGDFAGTRVDADTFGSILQLISGVAQIGAVGSLSLNLDRGDVLITPRFLALNLVDYQVLRSWLLVASWYLNHDGVGVFLAINGRGDRQLEGLSWSTRLLLWHRNGSNTLVIEGDLGALRGIGGIGLKLGVGRQRVHSLAVQGERRGNLGGGVVTIDDKVLQRGVIDAVILLSIRGLRIGRGRVSLGYGSGGWLGRILAIFGSNGGNFVALGKLFIGWNISGEGAWVVWVLGSGNFRAGGQGYLNFATLRGLNRNLLVIGLYRVNGRSSGGFWSLIGDLEFAALGALTIRRFSNQGVLRAVFQLKLTGLEVALFDCCDVAKRCHINCVFSVEGRLTVLVLTQFVGRNSDNLDRGCVSIGDVEQRDVLALRVFVLFALDSAGERLCIGAHRTCCRLWGSRLEGLGIKRIRLVGQDLHIIAYAVAIGIGFRGVGTKFTFVVVSEPIPIGIRNVEEVGLERVPQQRRLSTAVLLVVVRRKLRPLVRKVHRNPGRGVDALAVRGIGEVFSPLLKLVLDGVATGGVSCDAHDTVHIDPHLVLGFPVNAGLVWEIGQFGASCGSREPCLLVEVHLPLLRTLNWIAFHIRLVDRDVGDVLRYIRADVLVKNPVPVAVATKVPTCHRGGGSGLDGALLLIILQLLGDTVVVHILAGALEGV